LVKLVNGMLAVPSGFCSPTRSTWSGAVRPRPPANLWPTVSGARPCPGLHMPCGSLWVVRV